MVSLFSCFTRVYVQFYLRTKVLSKVCFTEGTKIDTLVVHVQYVVSRTCTRSVSIFRYSTEHIYTCTYNKLRKYVSTKVPSKI